MSKLKSALVAGGAGAIGLAVAERLKRTGVAVVIFDINQAAAAEAATRLDVRGYGIDVSYADAVARLARDTGPFDVVVNCADIYQRSLFLDTTPEQWRKLVNVNLEGVFAVTRATLPHMYQQGLGRVVNVASELGRTGSSDCAVYAAAKAGVIAFTKSIARESAGCGVTANVVELGSVGASPTAVYAGEQNQPTPKMLTKPPETADLIAATICFLASEEADFITGQVVGVSGERVLKQQISAI